MQTLEPMTTEDWLDLLHNKARLAKTIADRLLAATTHQEAAWAINDLYLYAQDVRHYLNNWRRDLAED